MPTNTNTLFSQPSWRLTGKSVDASLTVLGGHLAPVTFNLRGKKIQPFAIAPWHSEKLDPATPTILRVLRGDFFCFPFGGNTRPFKKEQHPVHGQTANDPWTLESSSRIDDAVSLHCSMLTTIRPARIDKFIILRDRETALYQKHIISGASGPMNLGHHACIQFPDSPRSGLISTSPCDFRQVWIEPTESPEARGYSALLPASSFKNLHRVNTVFHSTPADLSRFPARRGYEDIVININKPAPKLAWTAITFPRQRYAFIALKDPRILQSTLLWHSNGGRHYAPWNGRHVNVLGVEDITSFFHTGLAESARPNALTNLGIPTCLKLSPRQPTIVNYIMAVAAIPPRFDHVARVVREKDHITLLSQSGKIARTRVNVDFLFSSD